MLHVTKQPWYGRPLIKSFQSLLRWVSIFRIISRCFNLHNFSYIVCWSSMIFTLCFRNTDLGKLFFKTVATEESVRNILCQVCNYNDSIIDDLGLVWAFVSGASSLFMFIFMFGVKLVCYLIGEVVIGYIRISLLAADFLLGKDIETILTQRNWYYNWIKNSGWIKNKVYGRCRVQNLKVLHRS